MKIIHKIGNLYRWGLRTFIYNDIFSTLLFSKGYGKKINGNTIFVPFKYSWFYAGIYEVEKTAFIQNHCKAGDTVIDIGAHLGVFSFFLAKQVGVNGKVYSFEPAETTFNALIKTIRYNKFEGIVDARQMAVSNSSGELSFYIYKNSSISNGNSISKHNTSGQSKKITVNKISLDDLMIKENIHKLSLIKIDAEGAELDILKGGKNLITKFHPFITLEVHPKCFLDSEKTMTELFDTIIKYGYVIMINNKTLNLHEFCYYKTCFEVLLMPVQ